MEAREDNHASVNLNSVKFVIVNITGIESLVILRLSEESGAITTNKKLLFAWVIETAKQPDTLSSKVPFSLPAHPVSDTMSEESEI